VILFAGLHESWLVEPNEWQRTFTIITTEPNQLVAPIHNRMPVILPDAVVDDWLFPGATDFDKLASLLVPAPDDYLVATPVSPRANSVKNDDPDCLVPA
jgi:putative SOS response-associated peptidase YedK